MESFGLFNFLKSAFFPSSAETENASGASPDGGASSSAPSFPDLSALFGKPGPAPRSANAGKNEPSGAAAPKEAPPANAFTDNVSVENNRFVALMERHERAVKNIGRKAPRR